jgi:hypothetical protein
MQELCVGFNLRISVSDTESVGPEGFLTVVKASENWRRFADQLGWSDPVE